MKVAVKITGHGMPQWARINKISVGQTDPGSVIFIGCNQFVRFTQRTGRGGPVIRPHARDTFRLLKRIGCFGGAPINACLLRTECCDCVRTRCVAFKVRLHGITLHSHMECTTIWHLRPCTTTWHRINSHALPHHLKPQSSMM